MNSMPVITRECALNETKFGMRLLPESLMAASLISQPHTHPTASAVYRIVLAELRAITKIPSSRFCVQSCSKMHCPELIFQNRTIPSAPVDTNEAALRPLGAVKNNTILIHFVTFVY